MNTKSELVKYPHFIKRQPPLILEAQSLFHTLFASLLSKQLRAGMQEAEIDVNLHRREK